MSKNIWMIRAGEGGYLADNFAKGFVAIGWGDLGDLTGIKSQEQIKTLYVKTFPHDKPGRLGNAAAMIHKFCNLIKIGDSVVTYNPQTRQYPIGVIASDYYYKNGVVPDYPHIRKVTWEHWVPRDELDVQSRNSLGSTLTLFAISAEAWEDIQHVIKGGKKTRASITEAERSDFEEIKKNTVEEAHELLKDKLLELDEFEMQDLVAAVLRAMGYKARVSPPGADRGRDIFASPDGLGFQEPRIKVEVKHRPTTAMSAQQIRSFVGGLRPGDRALYVSTGGFTKDAKYEADRSNIPITLLGIDDLATLVESHYDSFDIEGRSLVPLTRIYWPT